MLETDKGTQPPLNLCIVIPAYKPGDELRATIDALLRQLEAEDYVHFIVVDDGSGPEFSPVFDSLAPFPSVTILRHAVNLGKGASLKTAFNHALLHETVCGVVTADADGQHLPDDILAIGRELMHTPDALVLGSRAFGEGVPLRSRFGNIATALVTRFLLGKRITDTQTGLRGIPLPLLKKFLRIKTNGYDFEMDMLVNTVEEHTPLIQHSISTVYINENNQSHFNPLRDSLAIYFVFMRHIANSLVTAGIDYAVFALIFLLGGTVGVSLVIGRLFAGLFNFTVAKQIVFKSDGKLSREALLFVMLVCVLTGASYIAISQLHEYGVPVLLAKIVTEAVIFFVSFSIQRSFVFVGVDSNRKNTDWDTYYKKRTVFSPTRLITQTILMGIFHKYTQRKISSFIEIGGGGSCFYEAIRKRYPEAAYSVVDKSEVGVAQFVARFADGQTKAVCSDILKPVNMERADVVFSVGLIEHFTHPEMVRVIEAHFALVKPGGLVVITYPTPTWLYRTIRFLAEALSVWRFHDEWPLTVAEVLPVAGQYGKVVYQRKNWWIGLTQEVVAVRVPPEHEKTPCS